MRVVATLPDFGGPQRSLLASGRMFALATLLTLVNQVSGTPYVSGGDSPAGTDCSGLVSWVTNAATGRPVYGDRFHPGNIESVCANGVPGRLPARRARRRLEQWPRRGDAAGWHSGLLRRRRRSEGRWRRCLPGAVQPPHVPAGTPRAARGSRDGAASSRPAARRSVDGPPPPAPMPPA